jgi:hypothetical protein
MKPLIMQLSTPATLSHVYIFSPASSSHTLSMSSSFKGEIKFHNCTKMLLLYIAMNSIGNVS